MAEKGCYTDCTEEIPQTEHYKVQSIGLGVKFGESTDAVHKKSNSPQELK